MIWGTVIGAAIFLAALTADRFGWPGLSLLAGYMAACWLGFIIGRWLNRDRAP